MNHPERASLLEMWHEQMQVRTLREQNQQILVLVKRIRSAEARLGWLGWVGWVGRVTGR